jgi:integrase
MGTGRSRSGGPSVLGRVMHGTKTDHGKDSAGRVVPVPPGLLALLAGMPKRIDATITRGGARERLLFPGPRGGLWDYPHWHRSVWAAGREVTGSDIRPHEMRHSFVSLMRAAGVDPADLADAAGHSVQTATTTYTHAMNRSFDDDEEGGRGMTRTLTPKDPSRR